ncbi:TolC family protein, partial [Klebsiella pneumoniae]|uniref:TolC family protein n=1 Tax=Klebsiella pneumoniae TaxID=573 RepID=UPI003851F208
YKLQEETTRFYQKSLAYQQALKVPDVTLGPNFDRNSNFQPNYVGLGISLPIPVLNKNKGNIKAAAANVNQQKAIVESAATDLQN